MHTSEALAMVPPQPTCQPNALVRQMPISQRNEYTPVAVHQGPVTSNSQPLAEEQALRRSTRAWWPSEKALQRIVAEDARDKDVAALLGECLEYEDDSVFLVAEAAAKDPFFQTDLAFSTQDRDIPRSYAQILHLPEEERDRWLQACQRECRSHLSIPSISPPLHPFEWTKAPPIRLTWVFAKKDVYKARIVMLGQRMVEGVHFNDTHAPVPCVRATLAITAALKRNLTQLDVKTAFLTAPIDIEVDVILPEGFGVGDGGYSRLPARIACPAPEDNPCPLPVRLQHPA